MKIIKGRLIQAPKLGEILAYPNGGILLDEDGAILKVYETVPREAPCEVVDYGDRLIMQSFADMHLHGPQYPMLGMGMDLPLIEWLKTYAFKTESRFSDPEYARGVYRKLAHKLIANGTTRIAMFGSLHVDATLILMEELEKAGLTGYVGKVNMDRNNEPYLTETTEESERETLRWLDGCGRFRYIRPILTPRFTPSCTNGLMAFLGKLSAERRLPVQSHLSENENEMAWVHELHPDTTHYYQSYQKYGLWKKRALMAHCVHSDETERKAMKDAGVYLVHCADSNVNLASGVCPVRTFLNEGVNVVLGSDIAGGALLPMSQNIQETIKISKIHSIATKGKDAFLSVNEAYYLATTAAALYFEGGAGFEEGKKLHAIVVDDGSFCPATRPLSLQERFERAIYMMGESNIVAVYSEGRKVL
ncbi:MAG: amidohydrolase family protein [Bacilli bacterium]|jgi:guanine deaminase|nr:amidohydrolase family protein [Bacilli bacterium]